jgi:hypothetical protein
LSVVAFCELIPVNFTRNQPDLAKGLHFCLFNNGWGTNYLGDTKTLDVHVKRLRSKIEVDPHSPEHLVTVRGLGYRFLDTGS